MYHTSEKTGKKVLNPGVVPTICAHKRTLPDSNNLQERLLARSRKVEEAQCPTPSDNGKFCILFIQVVLFAYTKFVISKHHLSSKFELTVRILLFAQVHFW